MPFSEEHERLVAIETALGCLLFEVIKMSKAPAATRDSFAAGMRDVAAGFPKYAMTSTASADNIVRAFGISSAIEQLLGELLEKICVNDGQAAPTTT